ncbi:MAG: porin [Thalassovita sp.]
MRNSILAGLVCLGTASAGWADGLTDAGFQFSADYTRSSSAGNDIDMLTFEATTDLRFGNNFRLGVGLGHSNMDAFGFDFGATSISLHPGYEVSPGLILGGFISHTTTTTPANFSPFNLYGLEADYFGEGFNISAYYGELTGSNVPSAGTNTSAGVSVAFDINPRLQVYADYDRDNFDFWGMDVTGTFLGVRWVIFDGISSAIPANLDVGVGRLEVNGVDYDQIRIGVNIPLGNQSQPDQSRDIDPFQSIGLQHTFSF